jgi:glycine betaine/proline transport system permease protein
MSTTLTKPTTGPPTPQPPSAEPPGRLAVPRWAWALGVIVAWIVVWWFTKGQNTLVLPGREHTELHDSLTGFRDDMIAGRDTNTFMQFSGWVAERVRDAVDFIQRLVSKPDLPRPVPQIGWLGVTAIVTWAALATAGWRIAILVAVSFLSFGLFGFWEESIDLLIMTGVAVALAVLIGMPLAVLIGSSKWANAVVSVVLDLMQTMPTFVYLLPIVLFFGIGVSGALVCILLYALPPIIRIAAYGIRTVSPTTIEATDSLGQTGLQRLRKVQLPMARKTIIVGLNQTTMAALAMATIVAYVDGPGLGQPVLDALELNKPGRAVVPGLLIVLCAVMLDRWTTAASERSEKLARAGGGNPRLRWRVLAGAGLAVLVALWMSRFYSWAAEFPENTIATTVAERAQSATTWVTDTFSEPSGWLKDAVSYLLLNPLQDLLAESPWWLAGAAIVVLALIAGSWRGAVAAVVCLGGIWYLDLWHDAMITLSMTLVATLLVMVLAVVFGVWMARRRMADLVIRPLLDLGQTIPPFVYLLPCLALFDPTRFTAIVAGVVYAAPVAIKLVADGVRAVPGETVEASRSAGANAWQEITKVQLPMARGSLVLAANQGLLYVLSMAVIGGLVGAGALGYDIVLGFSRSEEWGKGMAAGLTIVLLGIMLDRIARAAARTETVTHDPTKRPWWRWGF